MTGDKAVEVIRRTLGSIDKAVGVVDIKTSQHTIGFTVKLVKWGIRFSTTIDEIILMGAEADLMKRSPGHDGDNGLGDLKSQLKKAISTATPSTRVDY